MAWTQKHRDGWLARWQEFDYEKKQRVTRSKHFKTREEAEAYAARMRPGEALSNPKTWSRDAREIAGIDLPRAGEERFRVDRYLSTMVEALDVRDTTRAAYRTSVRLHFTGTEFGRADLRYLSGEDLTKWWGKLDLPPGAKRRAHQLLKMAVKRVLQTGDRTDDPFVRAPDVRSPRAPHRDVIPLTVPEVEALAEAAPSERARLGILLQSYCGLRAGELGGLHVEDVDGVRLHLRRQVVRVGGPGGLRETELKTKAARRVVTMPASLAAEVEALIGERTEGSLFGVRDSVRINDDVYEARKRAGIRKKVSSHLLRHTAVSLWVANGASPVDVQRMVGHANVTETLGTYGHLFEYGGQELADKMEQLRSEQS
jgi:integrase